jgi:hypothetical protein
MKVKERSQIEITVHDLFIDSLLHPGLLVTGRGHTFLGFHSIK